jgi:hypothetical protein
MFYKNLISPDVNIVIGMCIYLLKKKRVPNILQYSLSVLIVGEYFKLELEKLNLVMLRSYSKMELWLKKLFILFPWLVTRVARPFLPDGHPAKNWTWRGLAENGTDLLYFYAGSMWFSILMIILLIKTII